MTWFMEVLKRASRKQKADSDNILYDKAFNIARTLKYDGYQLGLSSSMIYTFFDNKM